MNFLSAMLREEGGLEYKTSIVDTIITIIEENPDAKESGLSHLCEFIEDCEHTSLAVRILHLLGKEGPFSKNPSKYIRFVYNRVILENATVRAAAVAAMAQFGSACPDLKQNVTVLLGRCQMDIDDEVRDRATYYLAILNDGTPQLSKAYISSNDQMVSLTLLEKTLKDHLHGPLNEPFNLALVPKTAPAPTAAEDSHIDDAMIKTTITKTPRVTREEANVERLLQIPGIQRLGPLHKSAPSVQLTESETEYTVSVVKHCFPQHIVLQFDCVNTLSDQLLENVRVELLLPEGYIVRHVIPCAKLVYGEKESTYVILEFPADVSSSTGEFNLLNFFKFN
jgi:coatomer protein complex subunit gamma